MTSRWRRTMLDCSSGAAGQNGLWKENDMKRFGVLLASAALGAAVAASGPALAFGGGHGGGFGGGRMGGGFGGATRPPSRRERVRNRARPTLHLSSRHAL